MSAAFIDANIPMYAVGAPHLLRAPSFRVLNLVGERPEAFITSAEVLQEILHRYLGQRRRAYGQEVLGAFADLLAGRIEAVFAEDVLDAARLADSAPGAQARDLLHASVMRRLGVTRIISTDRGFDGIEGITRLDPANLDAWESSLD